MKKKQKEVHWRKYSGIIVAILAGVGIGLLVAPKPQAISLASQADINNAYRTITEQYYYSDKTLCSDPNGMISETEALTYFKKYLKINGYANRAVVRFCVKNTSYSDALLAKDKSGNWFLTEVNMNLSTRVNPKWQKQCLIQDITTPDTVVRPENQSIDDMNFQSCEKLASN